MHVVITGANRGIGLAMTEKFLKEGHDVTGLCRKTSQELSNTAARIMEGVDVTDLESLQKAAGELDHIDLLINNAGVLLGDSYDTVDFEDLQKQVEVNTFGPLKVALTIGKKVNEGGKIGIVTSRMGSIADNTSGGQYGYRLSKCAANAVGKSLAEDLRSQNVTVLLLHPGYVRTEMTRGNGLIDTPESAEGLFKIMMEKGLDKTGTFWHTSGEQLPW